MNMHVSHALFFKSVTVVTMCILYREYVIVLNNILCIARTDTEITLSS
jgi:hypothetical protein